MKDQDLAETKIPVDLQRLAADPQAHLILRLAHAYNDLANVSLLYKTIKQSDVNEQIKESAVMYLLMQNIVHLVGAIESLPEILTDWHCRGPLFQKVANSPDRKRMDVLLSQLSQYLEAEDRPDRVDGSNAGKLRQELNNLRNNIGAHYNPTKKGKFLNRALQDIIATEGKQTRNAGLESYILQVQNESRFVFAHDVSISAWKAQCIGIPTSAEDDIAKDMISKSKNFVMHLKDEFTEFAFLLIRAYLH